MLTNFVMSFSIHFWQELEISKFSDFWKFSYVGVATSSFWIVVFSFFGHFWDLCGTFRFIAALESQKFVLLLVKYLLLAFTNFWPCFKHMCSVPPVQITSSWSKPRVCARAASEASTSLQLVPRMARATPADHARREHEFLQAVRLNLPQKYYPEDATCSQRHNLKSRIFSFSELHSL